MNLNRTIHLEIDDNTPNCVISSLLSTCKKRVGDEYFKSRKKDIIKFLRDFERETSVGNPEMRGMATYVSAKTQSWTPANLWKAFIHLEEFNHDPSLRKLREFKKNEVGDKTEQYPYKMDCIMLYQILLEHNLPYDIDDTVEIMIKKIEERYRETKRESPPPKLVSPVIETEESEQVLKLREDIDQKTRKNKKLSQDLEEIREREMKLQNELDITKEKLSTQDTSKSILVEKEDEIKRLNEALLTLRENKTDGKEEKELPGDFDRDQSIQNLINNLTSQTDKVIWNMEKMLEDKIKFDFSAIDEKVYSEIIKNIGTYSTIYKSCLSDAEAVMYAFHFFKIDITEAADPVTEIKKYCQCKLDKKKYKPHDPKFRKEYNLNKTWYNTDKTWKPNFARFYKPESLAKVITYNGGTEDDTIEFFDRVEEDGETFYHGIPPPSSTSNGVDEDEAIISFFKNEDISDEKDVIAYGSGKEGDKFIYFTPEELKEYFEQEKDFNSFRNQNLQLPIHVIRKLNNICKEVKSDSFSDLGKRVKFFLETGKPTFPLLKELFSNYLTCQSEFETFFKNLYKLGLSGDEEEYEARIRKNDICLDKLPKKMIDLVNNLPNISKIEGYDRLFRTKGTMMSKVKTGNFKNRKQISELARFYYEGMSSDKIDE